MKGFSSGRPIILSAVLLGMFFQAGCSNSQANPIVPGQETIAQANASGEKVANVKYGYELAVPAGWQANPMDGQIVSTTACLYLSTKDEQQVTVRVAAATNGEIVADDVSNFRTLRSTKQQFTALEGEGTLFRLVKSTVADTKHWAEYHFVTTRNGFTFDISTEVLEDRETLPTYFPELLSGWKWLAPDISLAAIGTPGKLTSINMLNDSQGWGLAGGKILRTDDGGKNWAKVTPPGLNDNPQVIGSKFLDVDHAWLTVRDDSAASVVVFHTANGGQTWSENVISRKSSGEVYGGQLNFIDQENGWLLIEPEHGMSSRPGELYRATDGGEHWSEVAGPYDPQGQSGLPFAGPFTFHDALTGWLGGRQGAAFSPDHPLYMTTDGGRTWQPQDLPLPANRTNGKLDVNAPPKFFQDSVWDGVLSVIFIPGSYKTSDYATIFYTTGDSGRTWQAQGSLPGTRPASLQSAVNWWAWREDLSPSGLAAPVRGKLYRTSDGGKSWTIVGGAGDLARALEKGEKVR